MIPLTHQPEKENGTAENCRFLCITVPSASLVPPISPVLHEYLFKKESTAKHTAAPGERRKFLSDYFNFLAGVFALPSGLQITEKEINATTRDTIRQYEEFLRCELKNGDATIYGKLSCIRLFYEDYRRSNPSCCLTSDLFSDYPLPKSKKPEGRPNTAAYYLKFYRQIGGAYQLRDRLILSMILTMGLTASEICALNTTDVSCSREKIQLQITARTKPSAAASRKPKFRPAHPKLPVNPPTAFLLKNWLTIRPEGKTDADTQALFLTKYKRRFKESGIVFMLKNHALKLNLDPADIHPDVLRKFALQSYQDAGGNSAGLRDFFNCRLFAETDSPADPSVFTENPFITLLQHELKN